MVLYVRTPGLLLVVSGGGQARPAVRDLEELAKAQTVGVGAVAIRHHLAMICQLHERYPQAAGYYKQVYQLAGENTPAVVLNNYAYLLADNLKKPREAIPLAEKAARVARSDAHVLDTLGWCYVLDGQIEKGMDILEEARRSEELPEIFYHLACAYQKKGQDEAAQGMAQRALDAGREKGNKAIEDLANGLIRTLKEPSR